MAINVLFGITSIGVGLLKQSVLSVIIGLIWAFTPFIMWYISQDKEKELSLIHI